MALALSAPAALAQSSPNVVLILADDLGYGDVGPYDHDDNPETPMVTNTPVLDAMAGTGVRLTDYYAVAPVCTPTRAGLLTGRHNARIGLTSVTFPGDTHGLAPWETTLAEVLREQGYVTGAIGKWHLGDQLQFHPLAQGFQSWYGVPYSNDMVPLYVQRDMTVVETNPDQTQFTKNFTLEAKGFLTAAVAQSKPFFLYMPHVTPHVPVYVSAAFDGVTGRGLYADAIRELDDSVGQILAHLTTLGVADDTIVIFTSDNGPWHDSHGPELGHPDPWRWVGGSHGPLRGWKQELYEGGVRVPLIARWTGHIPPGTTSNQPVICMDLLVTLAALADGDLPTDRVIDGRNVLPVLDGSATLPAKDLYFYNGPLLGAMRSGRWKVHFDSNREPVELYDLQTDVGETTPINNLFLMSILADHARGFDCTLNDAPVPTTPTANLARHKPTTASDSEQCSTSLHAVDAQPSTQWNSGAGDDHWLYVDLGAVKPFRKVRLNWGSAYATQYRIEVSNDALNWVTLYTDLFGNGGTDEIPVQASGRYVRMRGFVSNGGGGYSLSEIGIFRIEVEDAGPHNGGQHPS